MNLSSLRSPTGFLLLLLFLLLGVGGVWVSAELVRQGVAAIQAWRGQRINQTAWQATFRERNLPVPSGGPREGYWGARIGTSREDPETGWILPAMVLPGLLEIREDGSQHVSAGGSDGESLEILVLGGSVAFGAYASDINNTYFSQISRELANMGRKNSVTVWSAGAWKSSQEVAALKKALRPGHPTPDMVLFLNGLNDITNGSNAHTLFGIETPTLDGSPWHPLYHEGDFDERVRVFLENMEAARILSEAAGARMAVALQPALFEKTPLSRLERALEEVSLRPLGPRHVVKAAYEKIRRGLQNAAETHSGLTFVDCSRIFDGDPATTFADVWHFSDPGHRVLAECLLPAVVATGTRSDPAVGSVDGG